MGSARAEDLERRARAMAGANVAQWAGADPCQAIISGMAVDGPALTDYSDQGCAARAALARHTRDRARALLGEVSVSGPVAAATAVMAERCALEAELHESGQMLRRLDIITSPLPEIRRVIDLTVPHAGDEDEWAVFTERLAAVPGAVASHLAGLDTAAARGDVPAIRQVDAVARQCAQLADRRHFTTTVCRAAPEGSPSRNGGDGLRAAAGAADTAYGRAGQWLRERLGPLAGPTDAFGAERYARWARWYIGAEVDLHEAHAWAAERFVELEDRAANAARRIDAGADRRDVLAGLHRAAAYHVVGPDRARDWLRGCSEAARQVSGDLFEVPEELTVLEWKVTVAGGVHYLAPAEDGSRPGTVWWSLPEGEPLLTWLAKPTVVHEGVPGHHLQRGLVTLLGDRLTPFQRYRCEIAGYDEGWGLYVEQLMDTLGFYETPAEELGFLQNQFLRTARVLVDIGVHLELEIPKALGPASSGPWTADSARAFLADRVGLAGAFLDFELERYLGRGGQAIAYTLGEKRWLDILNTIAPHGGTTLRAAHAAALSLGPLTFDQLEDALSPNPE